MTHRTLKLFLVVALLSFSGCWAKKSSLKQEVVLRVKSESLSLESFSEDLARRMRDQPLVLAKDPKLLKKVKDQILQDFTVFALSKSWAQDHGVGLTENELDYEVSAVRSSYPNDLAFREALAEENISFNKWKTGLTSSALTRKVFRKIASTVPNPTQEEMLKYYRDNQSEFKKPQRALIKQIVVDKKVMAQQIEKKIKGSNFEELARKYSIAPEASAGGLVGWIEKGRLEVFDHAFSLKPGRVSDVLESPYGFHLIRLEELREAGVESFTEAAPGIRERLLLDREQSTFSHWLDQQISGTKVWRNEALIEATQLEFMDK